MLIWFESLLIIRFFALFACSNPFQGSTHRPLRVGTTRAVPGSLVQLIKSVTSLYSRVIRRNGTVDEKSDIWDLCLHWIVSNFNLYQDLLTASTVKGHERNNCNSRGHYTVVIRSLDGQKPCLIHILWQKWV